MTTFGYNGKILFIDLETCKTRIEEKDDNFWRIYIGGGLLATQLLLEHTPPGIDAFDAENLLIFASSVVAGHPYPSLQRFTISCKSPLTGGIGETRCEGPFAKFLKSSGYEAIVIHGAATTPKNIIIEDGIVHFEKAIDIWGMPTSEADETLQERHGDNIGTAVIGPAGENCVRYATITTNRHHLAFRMGGGAVMGSKNIKAIVLKGGELPAVSAPEKCIALIKSYKDRIAGNELTNWQEVAPGFAAWVHLLGEEASLCTRNFKDSVFEKAANYDQDVFMERFDGVAPCEGCPSDCIKTFSGGAEVDNPAPRGIHQEITCSLGPNIGTESMKDVLDLNILCLEYGLDPVSLGFSLSMIMECVEEGIITTEELGIDLRFGNIEAIRKSIELISTRSGFFNIIADGVKRASEKIGKGSEKYALHVKGLEMVPVEPRCQTNLGLGFATAPIGPRYDICEHDWDFDPSVGWSHTLKNANTMGILNRVAMDELSIDKVRNFKALNSLWSAADSLGMCIFAISPTRILTLEEMAGLVSQITGWNFSSFELMKIGERRNTLMRIYNLREGLTAEDDTLPDRFFDDPIRQGRWRGTVIDRAKFSAMIKSYYLMIGWNDAGIPLTETLYDLNLNEHVK